MHKSCLQSSGAFSHSQHGARRPNMQVTQCILIQFAMDCPEVSSSTLICSVTELLVRVHDKTRLL